MQGPTMPVYLNFVVTLGVQLNYINKCIGAAISLPNVGRGRQVPRCME